MSSEWWEVYRDLCQQTLVLKRYTTTDPDRVADEYSVRGNARQYLDHELVGAIRQGDYRIVVLAEDLIDLSFPLPIVGTDRIMVGDLELAILIPNQRKDFDGNLVAYELHCRG
jgi:hypothetical protein